MQGWLSLSLVIHGFLRIPWEHFSFLLLTLGSLLPSPFHFLKHQTPCHEMNRQGFLLKMAVWHAHTINDNSINDVVHFRALLCTYIALRCIISSTIWGTHTPPTLL